MSPNNVIAYWMSEKKLQKINWKDFENVCQKHGFKLFKIDFNHSLESQPFKIFIHKMTDIIAAANDGNESSIKVVKAIEKYVEANPNLIIIDPIENVKSLLNRYNTFKLLKETEGIDTPNFCHIPNSSIHDIKRRLKEANIQFPFICKPYLAHGSKKEAHTMVLIFNENNLKDCMAPCVAQSFINHDAVLYKVFIVGSKNYSVQRPSLKNFYNCNDSKSILFDSSAISKANTCSELTVLDSCEISKELIEPTQKLIDWIAQSIRKSFGMDLLGADLIIDNKSGSHFIVDVNAYPGYDGFPNFHESLMQLVLSKFTSGNNRPCDNETKTVLINNAMNSSGPMNDDSALSSDINFI